MKKLLAILIVAIPYVNAAQPKPLSKKEATALAATAKTPEDHERLALYYEFETHRLVTKAREHEQMGKEFRDHPAALGLKTPMNPQSAAHCDYLAASYRGSAKAAGKLAASHRQAARQLLQQQ